MLFIFYYQGIRFILDYQTGTCPLKSEIGQKKIDARFLSILGEEINDQDAVIKIRDKSRRALIQAALGGAGLTALTFLGLVVQ